MVDERRGARCRQREGEPSAVASRPSAMSRAARTSSLVACGQPDEAGRRSSGRLDLLDDPRHGPHGSQAGHGRAGHPSGVHAESPGSAWIQLPPLWRTNRRSRRSSLKS